MTAETIVRVTPLTGRPLYRCTECGGCSRTRSPMHAADCTVLGQ